MKHFAALILAAGAMAQPWSPAAAYPDGLTPVLGQALWDSSIWTSHTVTQWPAGTLPASCAYEMGIRGCSATNVMVYNVTYSDCTRPWVFCRCNTSPVSIGRSADIFGRLPVHLRSMVRHPQMVPHSGSGCGGAAADNGDLQFAGDCPIEVLAHEASHLVDNRGDVPGQDFSSKSAFVQAMTNDTCNVSEYARTAGRHETFAETGVVALYYVKTGNLPPVVSPATTGCFNYQLQTLVNRFGTQYYTYGGTCVNRAADSPTVSALKMAKMVRSTKSGPSCGLELSSK